MSALAEDIKQLLSEAVNTAQHANKTAIDELKNETDQSFEKHDTLLKETQKKAAEAATKYAQEIQDQEVKIKGLEESQRFLEKQFSRMPDGASNDAREDLYRKEFVKYIRKGKPFDHNHVEEICKHYAQKTLIDGDDDDIAHYTKTLIAGNNPQGGYFIRPDRSATMIQRIFETSPLRTVANVTTTNSDVLEFVVDDNEATSGGWVGEVESRSETTTPDIGLETIPVHEQFAQPKATQKMLDDAGFDIESWLSRKITDKMTRTENATFVNGDGSKKPRGFLDYPAWSVAGVYERGKIEQIDSNGAAGAPFSSDSLKKTQNSLIEDYQASAVWGIKRSAFENIITLKDDDGRYIFNTRFLQERDPMNLLGKRVIFMNDMPEADTNDNLAMVYGDFSLGYTIVDRLGFRVIRDEFTDKPFIKFYTTKRVGGAVTNYQSLKLIKITGL
jgi:HK97 family phage major capsid protein